MKLQNFLKETNENNYSKPSAYIPSSNIYASQAIITSQRLKARQTRCQGDKPLLFQKFIVTKAQILSCFPVFASDTIIIYQRKSCALIGQGPYGPMTSFLLIYGPEHRPMAQHYAVTPLECAKTAAPLSKKKKKLRGCSSPPS